MISIELIIPERELRLCVRVRKRLKVGELKSFLRGFSGLDNDCFFIIDGRNNVPDDVTLSEAGIHDGSGVIIGIENDEH